MLMIMNIKKIFGTILTVLGIGGLIYSTVVFVFTSGELHESRTFIINCIFSLLFLFIGINFIPNKKPNLNS